MQNNLNGLIKYFTKNKMPARFYKCLAFRRQHVKHILCLPFFSFLIIDWWFNYIHFIINWIFFPLWKHDRRINEQLASNKNSTSWKINDLSLIFDNIRQTFTIIENTYDFFFFKIKIWHLKDGNIPHNKICGIEFSKLAQESHNPVCYFWNHYRTLERESVLRNMK